MAFVLRKLPFLRNCGWFCVAESPPLRRRKPQNAFERSIFQNLSLEITDLDTLTHLLQALRKLFNEIHFDVEIDGKVGILVGRVDGSTHVEIDVGGFLKEQTADHGCTVLLEVPLLVECILAQIVLGVLDDLIHGDNTLGHQVNTLDMGDGGNVAPLKAQADLDSLAQILGGDGGGRTSADDVLALLGEEQRHHTTRVVSVGGRAEQDVHRLSLADLDHAGGGIVAGLVAVELVALVHQHGGQVLGGVSTRHQSLHEVGDLLPFPTEVVLTTHARMGTTITHGDEHVILLELDGRLVDLLTADIHFGLGVIVLLEITDHDDVGIIVLDNLRCLVVSDVHDGKSGVGYSSVRAHRQCCCDCGNAILDRQPLSHHGGDYLGGKGVPFRDAHGIVGQLVLFCIEKDIALDDMTLEEYKAISPVFEEDIYEEISLKTCVEKRMTIGAPGMEAMKKVIAINERYLSE